MKNIYNYSKERLEDYLVNNNFKKFNARQIIEWLYRHKVESFDEMSNISKSLKKHLKENFEFSLPSIIFVEEGDAVKKYLLKLKDNSLIEAVLMRHHYGLSLCVSTQVGCNMGCLFCESGRLKKKKDLEVSEMVGSLLVIEKALGKRISHVVLMGIGEPFDNYDNVIEFIKLLNDPFGLEIGARHITLSTCGIIPKIIEFSNLDIQVNLAISLHSAIDSVRNSLMPINKAYSLKDLSNALTIYQDKTKRRITFEYILLKGINDSEKDIKALVDYVKPFNAYINLIPYNETSNDGFKRVDDINIKRIYDIIKSSKIDVTIRREFGGNISAACGQLRARKETM